MTHMAQGSILGKSSGRRTSLRRTELDLYRMSAYVLMSTMFTFSFGPKFGCLALQSQSKATRPASVIRYWIAQEKNSGRMNRLTRGEKTRSSSNRIKRYIERNPVKAGLVSDAEKWPWSVL